MKTSMVPAQVTTVEDKIAGNLSLPQLLLLSAPVFIGGGLYILLPPNLKFSFFKLLLNGLIAIGFLAMAVRVRGKLVIAWLVVILRYRLRPRYYVFDKNDIYLRQPVIGPVRPLAIKAGASRSKRRSPAGPVLPVPEIVRLEGVIADPRAKLSFTSDKKGGLNVRITEIK